MPPAGEQPADCRTVVFPFSERPLVSILIPSRNQPKLLENCLNSLRKNIGPEVEYEVVIVLNAATEEVKSFVHERTQGAVVLESAANLAVAGGYNRARSAARGEFLLLLHDDTEVEPGWIEALLETLSENPAAGAVGSLQLFPDGTPQRAGSILWRNALSSPAWGNGAPDPGIFTDVRAVDYIGTCSSLVRSTTWNAIGGMDEEIYPAYYVDTDFCMRIRRLGQTVMCDPRSRLKHHQGASTNKKFRYFINQRNQTYFVKKWAAELAGQEPHAPDDPAAIARANQLTESTAARLIERWNGFPQPQHAAPLLDPIHHERQHFQRELAVLSEYLERLEAADDHKNGLLKTAGMNLHAALEKVKKQRARIVRQEAKLRRVQKHPIRRLLLHIRKFFK